MKLTVKARIIASISLICPGLSSIAYAGDGGGWKCTGGRITEGCDSNSGPLGTCTFNVEDRKYGAILASGNYTPLQAPYESYTELVGTGDCLSTPAVAI